MSGGRSEYNAPKDAENGRTPEVHGRFYSILPPDHAKVTQWRLKLAAMLMEQVGEPVHEGLNFILEELPQGYALWEHAPAPDDTNTNSQKITTATTSRHRSDKRTDTYLYGHPGGRTKRFRSPQDFFPHLFWLCTDKDGDRANCSCKLCNSGRDAVDTQNAAPKNESAEREDAADGKALSGVKEETPVAVKDEPQSSAVMKTTSSATLPRVIRSPEQKFDSEANGPFIYRPGELVWFNKGSAWGLAVIIRRQIMNSVPQYLLQPLSHPFRHCSHLIKKQDSIRPWLAWSVPSTTHVQISNLTYDQVPWDSVLRGELGNGDAEVDGSILAAKRIDGSYTFFDRLEMPTAAPGEVFYNGMFLGAEKIWVGEPVRVRVANDDIVIMVIQQMIERTPATTAYVTLAGDIYKFVEMPTPALYKDRKNWPTPNLPPRIVADLQYRNEVSDNAKRNVWHEWRLLEPMARRAITDIKGRWYETSALLPILRGGEFQHDVAKGITSDAGVWMNGRGDSSNGAGQRKKNRLDTLGNAVPADIKISRGLNGPAAENLFPVEPPNVQVNRAPVNDGQYGSVGGTTDGEMDQFMNLDHAAEHQEFYGNANMHL